MPTGERVEIFRGVEGLWYFHRIAGNNEIVSSSEGYQNHADAIATSRKIFSDVPIYEDGKLVEEGDDSAAGRQDDTTPESDTEQDDAIT